jgi:hypothetical protein
MDAKTIPLSVGLAKWCYEVNLRKVSRQHVSMKIQAGTVSEDAQMHQRPKLIEVLQRVCLGILSDRDDVTCTNKKRPAAVSLRNQLCVP